MPFPADLPSIARQWAKNPIEAFVVLGEGLRHASRKLGRDAAAAGSVDKHLSAEELVHGVIEVMVERCGLLATAVLRSWRLEKAEDIGALTYYLIEQGVLGKQADDRPEDFSKLPALAHLVQQYFQEHLQHALSAKPA